MLLPRAVVAETLDLNGTDKTVTALSELDGYDGVTNSSETPATLTFSLSDTWNQNETYAGVLAGNLTVVKEKKGMLALSGANTYTGGTVINLGKLRARSATAFGAATGTITVNADLNAAGLTGDIDTSTAVIFEVADTTFAYPIVCASWTNHGQRPAGYGSATLFNIAACANNITLTGDITGGDVSLRLGSDTPWNNGDSRSGLIVTGAIDCGDGALHLASRAVDLKLKGAVTCKLMAMPNSSSYPTRPCLYNANNSIGTIDVGRCNSGGGFYAGGANVLGGAILMSSSANFKDSISDSCSNNIKLEGQSQVIDRPHRYHAKSKSAAFTTAAHFIELDAASYPTLTMNGTASDENDWIFSGVRHNLVWSPTGDFTLLNVSRKHKTAGAITVARGCFGLDENCTFASVTSVVVAAGSVFSNASTIASSLAALKVLTLGAGAKAYLPADALTANTVTLRLDPTAEVIFPGETASVSFGDIYVGGKCLGAGTYRTTSDGWSRSLPQVKGAATIVNANKAGVADVETATWDAGGSDTLLHTKENWEGDQTPDFALLPVKATFAAGTTATADRKTLMGSLAFAAPGDFTLVAEDEGAVAVSLGLTAANDKTTSHRYEISAPLRMDANQSWAFGTNANVKLSGGLSTPEETSITTTVESFQPLWFAGTGEDGYTGVWKFPNARHPAGTAKYYSPCVIATGENPFGGAGATVKMAGGLQSGEILNRAVLPKNPQYSDTRYSNTLVLSNATVGATLDFPYSEGEDRYGAAIVAPTLTTNVVNGAVTNVRQIIIGERAQLVFNAPVVIHANNMGTSGSLCFQFDHCGTDSEWLKQSVVAFNGRVTFPTGSKKAAEMNQMKFANFCFNAPSNVMDYVGSSSYFVLQTGADYAFANGRTKIQFRSGSEANRTSIFKLNGHPQHIGSITQGAVGTVIESTAEADLRINQTEDVTFRGTIQSTVNVIKEGTATLALSHAAALAAGVTLAEGALAPASGAFASTVQLTFAGGTLTLPDGEMTVSKAYYVDGDGVTQPLRKGTYQAGDGSPIGASLTGSGTLKVVKSDFKYGLIMVVQ